MPRTLCLALAFAVLLLAPASLRAEELLRDALTGKTQAEQGDAAVKPPANPRDTTPFPGPVTKQPGQPVTPGNALEIIKKAADAQGDISPLTLKALQNDPKAMETVGRAPSRPAPAPPQRDGGPKSNKAMYGDIVIHK